MKIFINAATLRVGGGRSVALNFLNAVNNQNLEDEFIVVVPDDSLFRSLSSKNFKLHFVPKFYHLPYFRLLLDRWILNIVKKNKPDKIFNMGNTALPSKKYKQITLFHFPYAVYPENKVWNKMKPKEYIISSLMVYFFKKRLKYTDIFLVQTNTVKTRMLNLYNLSNDKIFLAPNAISLDNFKGDLVKNEQIEKLTSNPSSYKLVCLSVYYPHKNIEILLEVAKLIKKRGLNIQIFTTLNPDENIKVKKLISEIEKFDLGSIFVNLGRVKMENIGYLYSRTDALILPTLLESFTGTYIESMYFRKKILTSDMDFAREICTAITWFFDAENPNDILEKILDSMSLKDNKEEQKAYEHALSMKNWNEVTEEILKIIKS